jgi:hypothetical protein
VGEAWLKSLKVGDTVIVESGWGRGRLGKVERITGTQVIVNDTRYRKKDGGMVGAHGYSRENIYEGTAERVAVVRQAWLADRLANFTWNRLTLEQLEAIYKQVRPEAPK